MFTGRLLPGVIRLAPVDPLILTQARITLAALLLLPILAVVRKGAIRLPAGQAWRAAALGVAGMSASNYFYYLAIARTNVATAIILQYTAPIWVVVYLVARGRQRATWARIATVAMALAGIALVLELGRPGAALELDPIGVGGALLAAFAFAYYNIGGEALTQRADAVLVSLYMLVGAAVFWLLINPPWRWWQAHYSGTQWGFFLAFSLLATLAPTLLYISGLRYLDPTRAVVTSCLEPVAGILLAAVFLGEALDLEKAAGVATVLGAIVLIQRRGSV